MSLTAPAAHPARAATAGAGLLVGGTVLGVGLTARGARATGEMRLDEVVAAHREPSLTALARVIDAGLGTRGGILVLAALCALVAVRSRPGAVVLGVTTTAGWLVVALGKVVVGRPRPPAVEVDALVRATGATSYPSGHTGLAAALLAGIVLALRSAGRSTGWVWLLGAPFVAVVAASRLYLGVHYLGDVVGAVLLVTGTTLLAAAGTTWLVVPRAGRPPRPVVREDVSRES